MIADIAKILIVLGLIFVVVKGLGKRPNIYNKLYILHKAGPGLATILAFVHGLTYVPISQTYVWTGWFLGLTLLALMFIGIFLGFKGNWVPFDDDKIFEMLGCIDSTNQLLILQMYFSWRWK